MERAMSGRRQLRRRHWRARLRRTAAAHRRHHDLVAAADAAAIDLGATAEAELLGHADAYLAEPPAVTGDRNGIAREPGIGFDELLFDLVGRGGDRLRDLEIRLRDPHHRARLAHGLEITPRAEPGAGAVLVPFVEDQ